MTVSTGVWERLDAGFRLDPATGCLLWMRAKTKAGYGQIRIGGRSGKSIYTHRLSYERHKGPIPEGAELDHLCAQAHGFNPIYRSCGNPDHLEPVTHAQNLGRGRYAMMTHCKRGHEFTPDNTYFQKTLRGISRRCRFCHKQRCRERRERNGRRV